jgi:hypothetical protein
MRYNFSGGCRYCTPVILANQEAGIRRIAVQSQPRQIVCEPLFRKYLTQKKSGGVTQGEGPEFKPQYHQKKKRKRKRNNFPKIYGEEDHSAPKIMAKLFRRQTCLWFPHIHWLSSLSLSH